MRKVKLKIAMILWDEDNCAAYEKTWQWESYLSLYSCYIHTKELMFKEKRLCYDQTVISYMF
jgi:uncharacterized membrane protein YobD (UPF0266 family)